MLVSEVSDLYLAAICLQMKQEDEELFQVFLSRQPYIKERYEHFLAIIPLEKLIKS